MRVFEILAGELVKEEEEREMKSREGREGTWL